MTLAERLDDLLDAIRAGTAPPSFIVCVRDERELEIAKKLLRGRKGCAAIEFEINTDDPRLVCHEAER